ncbi:MAG TPA: hypothetical protein PLS03_13010 [Terrimicrobiaceae bacterium]|nr:hypothetical protein [Terrimicrobiaceae bacterium]
MAKQAHEIVGSHDKEERGFHSQKVLQAKRTERDVLLEFPDPVLAVTPGVVGVPDRIAMKIAVGHLLAETVVGPIFEERLACGLRTTADLLARDDVPAGSGPGVGWLVPPLLDRDAGADFQPVFQAADLALEVGACFGGKRCLWTIDKKC